jgi:hypothetical protein
MTLLDILDSCAFGWAAEHTCYIDLQRKKFYWRVHEVHFDRPKTVSSIENSTLERTSFRIRALTIEELEVGS